MESLSDREQMLLAMVAVEDGRLDREALLVALDGWVSQPTAELFEILVEHHALNAIDAEELIAAGAAADSSSVWTEAHANHALRAALDESASRHGERPAPHRTPQHTNVPHEEQRFQIGAAHATGGLGEVLRATDRQLNREVAVKRIRRLWADDADARARFLQEARITGRLEHPGIVPVYALGVADDARPYYAMRFIAGDSLDQAIERYHEHANGKVDRVAFNNLVRRLVDVCNTVEYAHSRGVVHRDLKPANVMLGPYGETVVVDWGLAKEIDAPSREPSFTDRYLPDGGSMPTQFGSAVGTPQYMSPEQAAGQTERQGVRSDVFSLGATLYHLLTGRPPYRGQSVADVIELAKGCRFPRPRSIRLDVSKPLEAICLKAMMPEPEDRCVSAGELGRELERWLADEPVEAYSEPWHGRWARWMRHHQARVAAIGVAGVLLTMGAVLGEAAWTSFERQRYAALAEIDAQDRARLAELRTAAASASDFSATEMRAGRYASAAGILEGAVALLADEPRLQSRRGELANRLDRTRRIVRFQELAQRSSELSYRGRTPEALGVAQSAVDALDVLDGGDWWNRLPDQELTPEQADALTWEVYGELIELAGLYADSLQVELSRGSSNPLAALLGSAGKTEAQAALAIDRLVQHFRPSEASRWIAGMAGLRLGMPTVVAPRALSEPWNAPDAAAIGMFNMLAAENPQFPFHAYRGSESALTSAGEAFRLASELEPSDYWAHLFLGYIELSRAERARKEERDPAVYFDHARQALGRCIALKPGDPFAYAERSVVNWREAAALAAADNSEQHTERVVRLRDLSIHDAQRARDLDPANPWFYWYEGHAVEETGNDVAAAMAYLQAIRMSWDFGGTTDRRPAKADQTRAMPEAILFAEKKRSQPDGEPIYNVLLAVARLAVNPAELEPALTEATLACEQDLAPDYAWSVRGMIHLRQGDIEQAIDDFHRAAAHDPNDLWAVFGIAECYERGDALSAALDAYDRALEFASTGEHRAAAELGRCRMLLQLGRPSAAAAALDNATTWQPSCDTNEIGTLAVEMQADHVLAVLARTTSGFTQRLVQGDSQRKFAVLPLLNGGFELGLARYWGNSAEGGPIWWARGDCRATASIDRGRFHRGRQALLVENPATGDPSDYATTTQVLPATGAARYRLTLWAAAEQLAAGGLRVEVDPLTEPVVVELPAGSYDWTRFEGEFEAPASGPGPSRTDVVQLTVRIVSTAQGRAWLDDLRIEQIPAR